MDFNLKEYRIIILYEFKVGLSQKQCIEQLFSAFGNDAHQWFSEFKRGRSDLSDEKREGRPSSADNDKNTKAARCLIIANNWITYKEMNSSLVVGMNTIQKILHGYLGVRKLCARWIPHRLTEELVCPNAAKVQFWSFKGSSGYHNRYETWIYCYEPESKRQSAQ